MGLTRMDGLMKMGEEEEREMDRRKREKYRRRREKGRRRREIGSDCATSQPYHQPIRAMSMSM